MARCTAVAILASVLLFSDLPTAFAGGSADIFRTNSQVPVSPAASVLGVVACKVEEPISPLSLAGAVERSLCNNPDTRSAWVAVKEQAAAVGESKAGYLPTLSANGRFVHDETISRVRNHPDLSSNFGSAVTSEGITLDWLLYDFGGRASRRQSAEALLMAAQANENTELLKTFRSAAQLYYAAQAAEEQLVADKEIVSDAAGSLQTAKERVSRGIAPITEQLQAETSFNQASLTQSRDQGEALASLGALASKMGLRADTQITLEQLDDRAQASDEYQGEVSHLIDEAVKIHPSVIAAQKELEAAQAAVTMSKSEGMPSLRLVGEYSRNNQPVQMGLGLPHYPSTGRDGYIGLEVSIPLFSGFATAYQVRRAQAEVEKQEVALDQVRQSVALDVWQSFQTLQAGSQSLKISLSLESVATAAWQSSQRRYQSGAGTILELLATQTALAQARQQRVKALTDWRFERLALASSLGQISLRK